jgi:ABC-type spermidine/putrescine transport system permease subunit II
MTALVSRADGSRRAGEAGLLLWYVLAVVFLFAPIVVSIVYSFNLGTVGKQTALFTGFTTGWYPAAWQNVSLRRAIETSLVVSFWSALIAVVIGSALGYALVRHPSAPVRRFLSGLTYVLLIVPETVTGISLLLFYAVTGLPLGLATLVFGITPLAIAVTALIVRAGVLTLDRRLEEAAADLGSNRWQTLRFIVLPRLAPAIGAAALMSYVFSFDNLVVSTFLTTPSVNTLPVYLYGSLQYGPSPAVYAAGAAVFGFTVVLLALAGILYRLTSRHRRSPSRRPTG